MKKIHILFIFFYPFIFSQAIREFDKTLETIANQWIENKREPLKLKGFGTLTCKNEFTLQSFFTLYTFQKTNVFLDYDIKCCQLLSKSIFQNNILHIIPAKTGIINHILPTSNTYSYSITLCNYIFLVKYIPENINNLEGKKEKEIKEKNEVNIYLEFMVFLLLILMGIIYFLIKHIQKKNEERKKILSEKQAEIKTLESKVNTAFEEVIELAKSNSPNFLTRFQEVYPEFCEHLIQRYPDIQNTELTYCAYIKLNFSSKEIAKYTFVTHKAIRMKRYRLRKKLSLKPEQDLDIWMKNLDNSTIRSL